MNPKMLNTEEGKMCDIFYHCSAAMVNSVVEKRGCIETPVAELRGVMPNITFDLSLALA